MEEVKKVTANERLKEIAEKAGVTEKEIEGIVVQTMHNKNRDMDAFIKNIEAQRQIASIKLNDLQMKNAEMEAKLAHHDLVQQMKEVFGSEEEKTERKSFWSWLKK